MASELPKTEKVVLLIPDEQNLFKDAVVIDACVGEQHTLTNTLTDHSIEKGANITDHSRPEPRRLVLECVHTNTPMSITEADEFGNVTSVATGSDMFFSPSFGTDRARQLWQRFVDLHLSPKLIDVKTARDFYKSMGIESVSSPVDAKTANALKFTVSLKEVKEVQNKFAQVVPTKDPRGQRKRDVGKATSKSLAARGVDWVGGLLK